MFKHISTKQSTKHKKDLTVTVLVYDQTRSMEVPAHRLGCADRNALAIWLGKLLCRAPISIHDPINKLWRSMRKKDSHPGWESFAEAMREAAACAAASGALTAAERQEKAERRAHAVSGMHLAARRAFSVGLSLEEAQNILREELAAGIHSD